MSSQATPFDVLGVGTSDSGDFSSWLGRPHQINEETMVMVQCGAAIASGSNGKQLVTALSSGQASWVVSISTGGAACAPLTCGAIPSSLTGPIASGAYFWALRDSWNHQLSVLGSTTGSAATTGGCYVGAPLFANATGGHLLDVFSGAATSSSVTGTTLDVFNLGNTAGTALQIQTGTAATTIWVRYRAPFRGAT